MTNSIDRVNILWQLYSVDEWPSTNDDDRQIVNVRRKILYLLIARLTYNWTRTIPFTYWLISTRLISLDLIIPESPRVLYRWLHLYSIYLATDDRKTSSSLHADIKVGGWQCLGHRSGFDWRLYLMIYTEDSTTTHLTITLLDISQTYKF